MSDREPTEREKLCKAYEDGRQVYEILSKLADRFDWSETVELVEKFVSDQMRTTAGVTERADMMSDQEQELEEEVRELKLANKQDAALAFGTASTAKLAAASECLAELKDLVQAATVEVDRLRAVVVEQEAQLEIWERQLGFSIDRLRKLRAAILQDG